MEHVEHHGRSTAYRHADRGEGLATCVFVHGSGANHLIWKSQDRLARRYTVVAVDLSGHGDSDDIDTPAGPKTLEHYVEDVMAVVEAVDGDVLVGNSLGGAVAMWTMLERSSDINGLCLVGTGAKLTVSEEIRNLLRDDFEAAVDLLHRPGWLLDEPDSPLGLASREAMFEVGRRVTERDFLTCHVFDVRDRLEEIDVPTLAIGGANDRLTPPYYHEYLATHIPDARFETLDDAAHLVMLERSQTFNEHLSTFVEEVR